MSLFKAYAYCLLIFCAIDFVWVGIIAKEWYRREVGHLLVDSIRWAPVVGFYVLYAAGILVFAVYPSIKLGSWQYALFYGAFLGLLSYAAYDLTNLATLKHWPILLALCDICWGSFVTGLTSFILFNLQNYLIK
ncbi:MAG: DUF2177 family protein [Simkaniaceae bacterium]|nr:DUF2177 family protein [Simkaniaceae bacterium]